MIHHKDSSALGKAAQAITYTATQAARYCKQLQSPHENQSTMTTAVIDLFVL